MLANPKSHLNKKSSESGFIICRNISGSCPYLSVVIIFFSWRSIHCEPISIRDTIKLRTSSTINSSAYKFDHRIPNFAQSNQLNDSHIANKKDRQFDYCDDDDANDGDDDDDDDDHDDHNDDDGEAGEPRRAVARWLVGSRCGSRSPASGNSGPKHCSHCSHIVIYVSTLFTVFT